MTQKIEDVKPLACGISNKTDIDQCSITASASPGTVTVKFVGENGETALILDQAIADGFADALLFVCLFVTHITLATLKHAQ